MRSGKIAPEAAAERSQVVCRLTQRRPLATTPPPSERSGQQGLGRVLELRRSPDVPGAWLWGNRGRFNSCERVRSPWKTPMRMDRSFGCAWVGARSVIGPSSPPQDPNSFGSTHCINHPRCGPTTQNGPAEHASGISSSRSSPSPSSFPANSIVSPSWYCSPPKVRVSPSHVTCSTGNMGTLEFSNLTHPSTSTKTP